MNPSRGPVLICFLIWATPRSKKEVKLVKEGRRRLQFFLSFQTFQSFSFHLEMKRNNKFFFHKNFYEASKFFATFSFFCFAAKKAVKIFVLVHCKQSWFRKAAVVWKVRNGFEGQFFKKAFLFECTHPQYN